MSAGDVLEATVTRHPAIDDSNPLAAVGLFTLVARKAPKDAGQVIEEAVAVARDAEVAVVVVNAATLVIMPWLDEVDGVLWVGLPGQEGGHAVAATLLGDIEPAGRLVTVPAFWLGHRLGYSTWS